MINVASIRKAIVEENLDGWLFFNFRHRDTLTDRILSISEDVSNTRPWFYLIPAIGNPQKLVSAVEASALSKLPGETKIFRSRAELTNLLKPATGTKIATQYSQALPILSFADHGTVLFLQEIGFNLVGSESLVQRIHGLLDGEGIASHERAAEHLYDIVSLCWDRIKNSNFSTLTEETVQSWILDEFDTRGLFTDHAPIIASGKHTSDPHYAPDGSGFKLIENEPFQFDLWAKEPGGIYADISWAGFMGTTVPDHVRDVFNALTAARDGAVDYIAQTASDGRRAQGMHVDEHVRSIIESAGFADGLVHRTGHGIDVECHGSGANLDSIEFPDARYLLEGSCFSIEPGIYLNDFGLRTEIDVYIMDGSPVISGRTPQTTLLQF